MISVMTTSPGRAWLGVGVPVGVAVGCWLGVAVGVAVDAGV
jgi:hypothetical protein